MKKLAWVHSHFYNWMGGTKFILEVVKRLKKDMDVEIFIQNGNPEYIAKFEKEWIIVHNLHSLSTNSSVFWAFLPFFCWRDEKKLQNLLEKGGFDSVMTSMFPMNYIATKLHGFRIFQYCYEPFAFFWDSEMLRLYNIINRILLKILRFFYWNIDIKATQFSSIIFTLVPETQNSINKIYSKESICTYLWVDVNFFNKKNSEKVPENIKKKIRWKKVLLHSNDFTPVKRLDFVLEIMEKLVLKDKNIVCLITISVPEINNIENLKQKIIAKWLSDNVIILWFVDYELLPIYYSIARMWLYTGTSQWWWTSAASLTVLEWMACWLPFIRTNDTLFEVLDWVNWFLLDPYDINSWINTIIENIDNNEKLELLSKNWVEHIKRNYNWVNVSNIIINNL